MWIRTSVFAVFALGLLCAPSSSSFAATFDDGVMIQAGEGTQAPPIDFGAIPGIFTASNNKTLNSAFADFGGTNAFNLDGTKILGTCNSTNSSVCVGSAFADPTGSDFHALIIYDYLGQLDPIVNVTATGALAAYFNENTIVLDISGLSFPAFSGGHYNYTELATVEFGTTAPVPLPLAFPLYGGALGLLGFVGWRGNRRKTA